MESAETTLHPERATTPRILLVLAILFTTVVASVVAADTNRPAASKSDYTVALRYGKESPLNSEAVQTLYSKAVELLETSNFNSRAAFWDWSISKVHEDYRQTVSGRYLIVSFKAPRKFATVGGEISVGEIVIGLNRPDYASALFTIDSEGRVVGHAKYDGPKCIELLNAVKKIANDADGGQRRPYLGNSVECCDNHLQISSPVAHFLAGGIKQLNILAHYENNHHRFPDTRAGTLGSGSLHEELDLPRALRPS